MIGQYGSFDYNKYAADFKDGFYGIEACLFNREEDTYNLLNESQSRGFKIGIHFPLRAGRSPYRDAFFMSQEPAVRNQAWRLIQQELDYAAKLQPDYMLFHYPKPVILDERADWSQWKFADRSEYIYDSEIALGELIEKTEELFQWLTEQSDAYHFTPVLEFDALSPYIYETDFLQRLLEKYRKIKLCLDTGRLYIQERIDPHFNARAVIRKFAKYAATIHLANARFREKLEIRHYPVLPDLSPQDGWAPIEDYLQIIKEENQSVKIMFEHRSDLISREQLEICYAWVDRLLNAKE
jgi:sugar phosphate isomerase/epimerase